MPYDNSMIGKTAVESQPLIRQVHVFVASFCLHNFWSKETTHKMTGAEAQSADVIVI